MLIHSHWCCRPALLSAAADGCADGVGSHAVTPGAARPWTACLRPTCRRFPTERQPQMAAAVKGGGVGAQLWVFRSLAARASPTGRRALLTNRNTSGLRFLASSAHADSAFRLSLLMEAAPLSSRPRRTVVGLNSKVADAWFIGFGVAAWLCMVAATSASSVLEAASSRAVSAHCSGGGG